MGPLSSNSVFCCSKTKLRVHCKAFFKWVGDGVGGPIGGDKAYRKFALKHHPDEMKRSMKVVFKVLIFWRMGCEFLGSPERTLCVSRGVLKAVLCLG